MASMFDDLSKAVPVKVDATTGKTKKVSESEPRAYIFLSADDNGRNNRDQLYVLTALSGKPQNAFGLAILEKAMDAIEEAIKKDLAKQGRDYDKEAKAILAAKRETEKSRKNAREGKAVPATEPESKTGKSKK